MVQAGSCQAAQALTLMHRMHKIVYLGCVGRVRAAASSWITVDERKCGMAPYSSWINLLRQRNSFEQINGAFVIIVYALYAVRDRDSFAISEIPLPIQERR